MNSTYLTARNIFDNIDLIYVNVSLQVVYMARDPRDVVVSLYHILKLKFLKNIEFDQFWHLFHEGYSKFFKKMRFF